MIGERLVNNADKLLSLYETDTRVIMRGKAGAEVEFGNALSLAEQKDGLIVDWQLHQASVPSDTRHVQRRGRQHARVSDISNIFDFFSVWLEARLHGRQDAWRHGEAFRCLGKRA